MENRWLVLRCSQVRMMTWTWVISMEMETNTWNPEKFRKEKQLNYLTSFMTLDKEVG